MNIVLWVGNIMHFLSFVQHKSFEIACSPEVTLFSRFDTGISFQGPDLMHSTSFEMSRQQTYRGSSTYVKWMRGTLIYDNALSPWICSNVYPTPSVYVTYLSHMISYRLQSMFFFPGILEWSLDGCWRVL